MTIHTEAWLNDRDALEDMLFEEALMREIEEDLAFEMALDIEYTECTYCNETAATACSICPADEPDVYNFNYIEDEIGMSSDEFYGIPDGTES